MIILSFDIGIKNLAFVLVETGKGDSLTTKILEWDIISVQSDGKKEDFNIVSENLIQVLYDKFGSDSYDVVLIENQPSLKNPVMKSIQMIIFTFFKMRAFQEGEGLKVKFVSASSKLKVHNTCDTSHITTKDKYRKNKLTSIAYCQHFLELSKNVNGVWIDVFDKCKKKDDRADTLGLAICFIENIRLPQ